MWLVCPQGVSLAQAKEKGQLVFLEGLNESLSVLIPQETDTGSQAMDFLRYIQRITVFFFLRVCFCFAGPVCFHCLSPTYHMNVSTYFQSWPVIIAIISISLVSLTPGILLLAWRVYTSLSGPVWAAPVRGERGQTTRRSGDPLCCWWMTSVCCWVWGSALGPCWTSATTAGPPSAPSCRFASHTI